MVAEVKGKSRADFEFFVGQGIHPFYLGMTIDQAIDSAVGWKIFSAARNSELYTLNVSFEINDKAIEVGFIDVRASISNAKSHYQIYVISTYDALLRDGREVASMNREEILNDILVEYTVFPEGMGFTAEDESASFTSRDGSITVHFLSGEKPLLSISRVPSLGE